MAQKIPDNICTCDIHEMQRLMEFFIKQDMVSCLVGPPGCGKTQSTKQIAARMGYDVWYFNGIHEDVTDRKGAPYADPKKQRVVWFPPDDLPFETENILVLLDDFMQAVPSVMNSWSNIISERRVGKRKLHPSTRFVLTGNDVQHRSGVYRIPANVARRAKFIYPMPNQRQWDRDFAAKNNVHPFPRAYLRFKPDSLFIFPDRQDEKAFPNPASWEDVSKCCWGQPPEDLELPIYAACIGLGEGTSFKAFTKMYKALVNPTDVIRDPNGTPIPDGMDVKYSVCAALAAIADKKNFTNIVTYLDRMEEEFSVLGVTMATQKDEGLRNTPAFTKWSIAHKDVMSGADF